MTAAKRKTDQETRRERLVVSAVNPVDGTMMEVMVSYERLHAVASRSKGQIKEAAFVVPEILTRPAAIFEGLNREEDLDNESDGWLCYSGVPTRAFNKDGLEISPWPAQVFLVFVNSEKMAYLWYWYACDEDDPCLPQGYQNRFDRRAL